MALRRAGMHLFAHRLGHDSVFETGDPAREGAPVALLEPFQIARQVLPEIDVGAPDDLADHALQAHALAIFGRVDAGHTVVVQLLDLGRHDHPAAAAEYLDLLAAALAQQIDHV